MKRFSFALALAIATTSAFGSEKQDYQYKLVVQTGQTISGNQLAAITAPAINNLNNVIFTASVKAPIGSSTFLAGLFSPEKQIAPYTDIQEARACSRMPSPNSTNYGLFTRDKVVALSGH